MELAKTDLAALPESERNILTLSGARLLLSLIHISVFRELYRVLRKDGTLWLNLADTYCGTGNKGGYADPKNPKGRTGQRIARNSRVTAHFYTAILTHIKIINKYFIFINL